MAGHSQFKNIMHRKGAQDARRGRQFARIIREITVSARHGLPDPASNPRLRAAVMAAAARGLSTIILSEPFAARRELALSLGATHVIDPTAGDLPDQVRGIVEGGVAYAFDTTGSSAVIEGTIASLAPHATLGLVGVPADPAAMIPLSIFQSLVLGITVKGIIEGDAVPGELIPEMLELHAQGKFPYEKLITTYPLSEINDALEAQAKGEAIKVVLIPGS